MKRVWCLTVLLVLSAAASAAPPSRALFDAIRQVESAGNDRATGDGGRSKGPMQCQRVAWAEACRHGRVQWDYEQYVWSRRHSEQVFLWYTSAYGAVTAEERARCWNVGPRWATRARRAGGLYWAKVRAEIERQAP